MVILTTFIWTLVYGKKPVNMPSLVYNIQSDFQNVPINIVFFVKDNEWKNARCTHTSHANKSLAMSYARSIYDTI